MEPSAFEFIFPNSTPLHEHTYNHTPQKKNGKKSRAQEIYAFSKKKSHNPNIDEKTEIQRTPKTTIDIDEYTHISPSLHGSTAPPEQNTDIIRNILLGIKNTMIYNAKKDNINTINNDKELKKECLNITKIKEENGAFEFEEYAHKIFELLRSKFDLKGFKYLYKLYGIEKGNKYNISYAIKHWKSLITNSKSGQLFYRSKDNLFILKALKYDEWYFIRHTFLFNYFKYICKNIDSLLTKILGIYKINDTYFMIMKNINYSQIYHSMHKIYDLKGSTHKRQATRHKMVLNKQDFNAIIQSSTDDIENDIEPIENIRHKYSASWYKPTGNEDTNKIKIIKSDEKINDGSINDGSGSGGLIWKRSKILKDLDWIQDEQFVKIGKIRTSFFLQQLDKDLKFLIDMNVMDYSLVIGIHFNHPIENSSKDRKDNEDRWSVGKLFIYENGGMCYDYSEEENDKINTIKYKMEQKPQKDAIYFCGLIDFLQEYNTYKKVESFVKGLATDKSKISAIDPESYAKRLYSFVQNSVE